MRNTLHFYPQDCPHDSVYIAGDKRALVALLEAVKQALDNQPAIFDTYASDGEEYSVQIVIKTPEEMEKLTPKYSDLDY